MKKFYTKLKYLAVFLCLWPLAGQAAETYPRLANYYLSFFKPGQYQSLARWDLLIIQPDMVNLQADFFKYYRTHKPEGKLLAYLYPTAFFEPSLFYDLWGWRRELKSQINQNNWWLKDDSNAIVSPWPGLKIVNLTNQDWQKANWRFISSRYNLSAWDGVFYDLVDTEAAYYSDNLIDINADGAGDEASLVNRRWRRAMIDWLALTRQQLADKVIVINGNSWPGYQEDINGRLFETWPTPWEANGTWLDSMKPYLFQLPTLNQKPQIYIINAVYDDRRQESKDAQMRFALASTLLGDGYFSFDAGENSHSQEWWFDEYEVDLGQPLAEAKNLSGALWWRDFSRGAVVVNSGTVARRLNLPAGQFKRLAGLTEPWVNDGQAVTCLLLAPRQGLLLLRQGENQPDLSLSARSFDWQAANQPLSHWLIFKQRFGRWLDYFVR